MPILKKKAVKAVTKKLRAATKEAPAKAPGKALKARKNLTPTRTKGTADKKPRRVAHGVNFLPGSDFATVFSAMLDGSDSRVAITRSLQDYFSGTQTRGGKPKPVTTIMNSVLTRALDSGYTIDSHWKLIPPADEAPAKKGVRKPTKRLTKKVQGKAPIVLRPAGKRPAAKKATTRKSAPVKG